MTTKAQLIERAKLDFANESRILMIREADWHQEWLEARNPFVALQQWIKDKPRRAAGRAAWFAAKERLTQAKEAKSTRKAGLQPIKFQEIPA